MMLKIEDLKVGDGLVCIDRSGLFSTIQYAFKEHWAREFNNESKITKIGDDFIYLTGGFLIHDDQLKYFKKKEQSQYTFDDLIDVANDAVKNKLITQTRFSLSAIDTPLLIVVYFDGREGRYTDDNFLNGIEFIKSLYKETFVIETEEDMCEINGSAKVTLKNGNSFEVNELEHGYIQNNEQAISFRDRNDFWQTYSLFELKGAKVEQAKG